MKPTSDLRYLKKSVRRRIYFLRAFYVRSRRLDRCEQNAAAAFCVIELDNIIINLHREFLISSLYINCRTCSGHRISHNGLFPTEVSAALQIMRILEPKKYSKYKSSGVIRRRDETKIRDPLRVQLVAASCSLSNIASIVRALGINASVFSEISAYRNFYAHRNKETAANVMTALVKHGAATIDCEWEAVSQLVPGKPISIFEEWTYDLDIFMDLLLE